MSAHEDESPALRYFRANEGRWHAPFVFAVTDRPALGQRSLGALDRLRVFLMLLVPKLLGPFVIRTSVDATSRIASREVVHTTRISKWGLRLYDAVEVFRVEENGTDLVITRRERMWPSLVYSYEEGRSYGDVAPDGTCARYVFPFLGTKMHQTGTIETGGVRIVQETEFSRVELLLSRIARRSPQRTQRAP